MQDTVLEWNFYYTGVVLPGNVAIDGTLQEMDGKLLLCTCCQPDHQLLAQQ
jgi:hypothetical protein